MRKKYLIYVKVVAVSLSCMVATLTLFDLLTIVTHGIEFDVPDEDNFAWAIDPAEKRVLFLTNFTVKNHGAYDIDRIDINAHLGTDKGKFLLDFSMQELTVSRGSDKRFDIVIPVDLDDINIADWFPLLYQDTAFNLVLDIDADYMYRLVHVTVDETLSYNWTAPLSGSALDNMILPSLSSIIAIAQDFGGEYAEAAKTAIIEYAMTIEDFSVVSEDYGIWVNASETLNDTKEISCEVSIPFYGSGNLDIGFFTEIGLPGGVASAELKEVSITYAAD